jgi:hypothetical protein
MMLLQYLTIVRGNPVDEEEEESDTKLTSLLGYGSGLESE